MKRLSSASVITLRTVRNRNFNLACIVIRLMCRQCVPGSPFRPCLFDREPGYEAMMSQALTYTTTMDHNIHSNTHAVNGAGGHE